MRFLAHIGTARKPVNEDTSGLAGQIPLGNAPRIQLIAGSQATRDGFVLLRRNDDGSGRLAAPANAEHPGAGTDGEPAAFGSNEHGFAS